jgi:hypothetical protein
MDQRITNQKLHLFTDQERLENVPKKETNRYNVNKTSGQHPGSTSRYGPVPKRHMPTPGLEKISYDQ